MKAKGETCDWHVVRLLPSRKTGEAKHGTPLGCVFSTV
jgi:hypothetical protein